MQKIFIQKNHSIFVACKKICHIVIRGHGVSKIPVGLPCDVRYTKTLRPDWYSNRAFFMPTGFI